MSDLWQVERAFGIGRCRLRGPVKGAVCFANRASAPVTRPSRGGLGRVGFGENPICPRTEYTSLAAAGPGGSRARLRGLRSKRYP